MTMLASLLAAAWLAVTPELALENTNIVSYDEEQHWADYNRFRGDLSLNHQQYANFSGKLIVDNENRYGEQPSSLVNKTLIHRGYLQYRGETHLWTIGRQRIPFGVGRVWNPIDVFDPIDFQAKETDERRGTEAIHYEYAISQLANVDLTGAKQKMAARLKGFLEVADLALVTVWDDANDRDIIGWEMQGEIGQTGIEVRSEGGSFHDRVRHERTSEFIVGAEYGFANSLTLLGEYKYNDESQLDYGAVSLAYQFSMLWSGQVLGIINLDDHSSFITPTFSYSAADEITVSGGALIYHGNATDDFGSQPDQLYLRLFIHF
ncbi:MAG: hypothetical protein KKD73_10325 [Proteobacteria bacterium]|nr:hypothetical protein [Pseudomonadota bacterium]MBU1640819.1 hypothetical protein [Pseudomonadota bacterium]